MTLPQSLDEPKRIRALLVEDDRSYKLLLEECLSYIGGIEVDKVFSSDSATALDLFRTEHPDLVLLDIGLAGENGLELITPMLEAKPSTGIVVITGSPFAADIETARIHGAIGYILKPYSKQTIVQLLLTYLNYKEQIDLFARTMQVEQAASHARQHTEFFISWGKENL